VDPVAREAENQIEVLHGRGGIFALQEPLGPIARDLFAMPKSISTTLVLKWMARWYLGLNRVGLLT
jgi:hypothetical protein